MHSPFGVSRLVPPLALGLVLAAAAFAQTAVAQSANAAGDVAPSARPATVDRSPWLFKGSDITPDPNWHFGRLANGLRYAVRKNGVPPGQVSIRVRIDAGSLMERDSEQGFAHFMEHLSFRGSQFVADGDAKRVWQRLGATFGSDTNAATTPVSTLYKLDLPGATNASVDESLHILSGMMAKPDLTDAVIQSERPVVLAEQREQPGAQVHYGDAVRQTFFTGQPFASRSPIGTTKTLAAATQASIRAFHDRWYRPERTVLIVSGDLDAQQTEALVEKNFSSWQGVGPRPAEADFGKPDPKRPATAAIAEPGLPAVVSLAVVRPWVFHDDTVIFNQKRMVDTIAARIISRRLETRARAGGSFLQADVALEDVVRSANVTAVTVVPVGKDWEAALRDVRGVIADALALPPSQPEIDRELADYDRALRTEVETARVEASAKQADDMAQALDIRETVASPDVSYKILTDARAKRMFTPTAEYASTKRLFEGTTRALVNTQTVDATAPAKLAVALKADVSKLGGRREAVASISFAKLPPLGSPGTVVSREKIADLDMEQLTFSNGVRLLLYANSAETGRVYVKIRFGGGYNQLPADRRTPAWAGDVALMASGIGTLGQNELDQLTAGRRLGLDFSIDEDAFAVGAITSAADLKDELRLAALKLEHPGWDPRPVERAKVAMATSYAGFAASPDGVLGRDLSYLLHDGDPRWGVPPRDAVDALTPAAFRAFWEPVLRSGPIEVDVFGDVKADDAIAAVAATVGAIAPRPPSAVSAPPIRFPAHRSNPVVRTHEGQDNQAVAVIAWPTGGGLDQIADSRRLDLLAAVFSDRLFDRLRTASGASYSPNVQSQWPMGLPGGGRMIAIGQVPPDKTQLFFTMARQIAAELAAAPVTEDELRRVKAPMAQLVIRLATGNSFWLQQLAGASYDPKRIGAVRQLARDYGTTTAADLQEIARKYLRPDTDWTMEVLPKAVAAKAGLSETQAGR